MLAAQVGKALDRSFDDALAAFGGSRPTWLVLLAIKSGAGHTQSAVADRVGISGPTLVHHLDRLESSGLVVRNRDPANRRLQSITLTGDGDALFLRLRDAAVTFDRRLRAGFGEGDVIELRRMLTTMLTNVTPTEGV